MGLMTIEKARSGYEFHSGKASDVARQLGFAGIALIWLFRLPTEQGGYVVPDSLLLPAILIVTSLAADFLQYLVAAICWGTYSRWRERQPDVLDNAALTFNAPRQLNWPGNLFWVTKFAAITFAYTLLLRFLFQQFVQLSSAAS